MAMFFQFFCLCRLNLTIKVNFDTSRSAVSHNLCARLKEVVTHFFCHAGSHVACLSIPYFVVQSIGIVRQCT